MKLGNTLWEAIEFIEKHKPDMFYKLAKIVDPNIDQFEKDELDRYEKTDEGQVVISISTGIFKWNDGTYHDCSENTQDESQRPTRPGTN